MHDLAEDLVEIGCVTQWHGDERFSEVRKRARRRAAKIRDAAKEVQRLLRIINTESREFGEETAWSAHILDEVFDLKDKGQFGTSIYRMPNELSMLEVVSRRAIDLEKICSQLDPLASLPLSEPKSGPPPNMPVRYAVKACQEFWVNVEGRKWEIFTLNDTFVRKANMIAGLKNPCEQFVANMLSACGIRFNLTSLRSAWAEVDDL